jgi:hypothetical protein
VIRRPPPFDDLSKGKRKTVVKIAAQVFPVRVKNLHIFQKGIGKLPFLL